MLSLLGVLNAFVAVAFILASRPDIRKALVAFVSRTTSEMTFKKAVFMAAALIMAMLLAETLPFDLALPFAMDALAYIDIVAAVYFALANRQVRVWGRIAKDRLAVTASEALARIQIRRPLTSCARRIRQVGARLASKGTDDGDGGWAGAWRYAF